MKSTKSKNKDQANTSPLATPAKRGERVRVLRNMCGLTIHELAKKHSIGASTIKYWESAKSEGLSSKGAKKLVDAMLKEGIYCTYMWLMSGVGMHPQMIDVSYGDAVTEKLSAMHGTFEEETAIHNEVDMFLQNTPGAISLIAFDDTMTPYYCNGDTVGGNRLAGEDIVKAVGKHCIVETEDRQILCRKIIAGTVPGTYTLCCINPQTNVCPPNIYDIKITSAAPIVRIWKRTGAK